MKSGEIVVGYLRRRYQMKMIIVHILQYFLIRRQHAVQILRGCPFVRAEIHRQGDDRQQSVGSVKTREKFRSRFRHPVIFFVGFCRILHLRDILDRIVEHIPHRHGVVDLRLVFYSQKQIGGFVVLHRRDGFQHIAVLLYRNGFAFLSVWQNDRGRIQRLELLRLDDLSAFIQIKIERVRKNASVLHIGFGDCVLFRHRYHSLFHSYCIIFQ